jgi:hypothetical protein
MDKHLRLMGSSITALSPPSINLHKAQLNLKSTLLFNLYPRGTAPVPERRREKWIEHGDQTESKPASFGPNKNTAIAWSLFCHPILHK